MSTTSRSPGSAPWISIGPLSMWAWVRSTSRTSLAESLLPSWASVHSRRSTRNSLPGWTEAAGGTSGCQRLCPGTAWSRMDLDWSTLKTTSGMSGPSRAGAATGGVGGRPGGGRRAPAAGPAAAGSCWSPPDGRRWPPAVGGRRRAPPGRGGPAGPSTGAGCPGRRPGRAPTGRRSHGAADGEGPAGRTAVLILGHRLTPTEIFSVESIDPRRRVLSSPGQGELVQDLEVQAVGPGQDPLLKVAAPATAPPRAVVADGVGDLTNPVHLGCRPAGRAGPAGARPHSRTRRGC